MELLEKRKKDSMDDWEAIWNKNLKGIEKWSKWVKKKKLWILIDVGELCRESSQETLVSVGRRSSVAPMVIEDLRMEICRSKKNGFKRLRWGRKWLRWRSSEEDECAICLDQFKASEKIAHLRCAHRFHSDCLLPWLEGNAHCPCCRANVSGAN